MAQKQYWLMDGRANYDVDVAYVLECCSSLKKAKRNINNYGADTCIVDAETQEVVDSLMWRAEHSVHPDLKRATRRSKHLSNPAASSG
jgi:hypothetical protein